MGSGFVVVARRLQGESSTRRAGRRRGRVVVVLSGGAGARARRRQWQPCYGRDRFTGFTRVVVDGVLRSETSDGLRQKVIERGRERGE
eukprot:5581005-Prymnesium_polylepis.1